uniref:ADAMTS cysteine-rich domain-containing protein n=2 Tax=Graphocephala atropunctata TaxID=36148 RepID=A0A1B6LVJ0_9HEMI
MRACNLQPCPVRWWIGPWQLCPVTCGEQATRRRSVICVSGSEELALPDDACEGQSRPRHTEPCPDIPPCLLDPTAAPDTMQLKQSLRRYNKWSVLPWSQCSVSCGIGFKKRTILCGSHKCDVQTRPISVKQCYRHCPPTATPAL